MGFFKLDGDLLIIDRDEVRGVPVYKAILERDKGSKGDNDGRKKYFAFKEFMYIYLTTDYRSWLVKGGYNEKETHVQALKDAGLPDDYKPDMLIKEAMELYNQRQLDELPTIKAVNSIVKGLKISEKITESIIENIEGLIEYNKQLKKRKKEENGGQDVVNVADDLLQTQGLVQQLKQLTDISTNLPKTIETLEKLEDRLTKEESGATVARGGKEIGNRADPK